MEINRSAEAPMEIYLGNLAAYTGGDENGEWISLPQSEDYLKETLSRISRGGLDELIIQEVLFREDCGYLEEVVNEWSSVEDLNIVATLIGEIEHPAVRAYVEMVETPTILKLANLLMQENEIPFYSYEFEGIDTPGVSENMDEYVKLGYTLIEQNPELMEIKDTFKVGSGTLGMYLDAEAIGQDMVLHDYMAVDQYGYYDVRQEGPDLNLYTMEEIRKMYVPDSEKTITPDDLLEETNKADRVKEERSRSPEQLPAL